MEKLLFTEEEFIENYDHEIDLAVEVYGRMSGNGFQNNALCAFDFDFSSDKKEKLQPLGKLLNDDYGFNLSKIRKEGKFWVLEGTSPEQPYNEERLLYWALDLYSKGYQFDCRLTGYGGVIDPHQLDF